MPSLKVLNSPRPVQDDSSSTTTLAWAGWKMIIPSDWRPLRIEGLWEKGTMMVGDSAAAVFQIKWWRPQMKNFDAYRWIQRRIRSNKKSEKMNGSELRSPENFTNCVWVDENKKDLHRSLWYGYAPQAQLMFEFVINGAVP